MNIDYGNYPPQNEWSTSRKAIVSGALVAVAAGGVVIGYEAGSRPVPETLVPSTVITIPNPDLNPTNGNTQAMQVIQDACDAAHGLVDDIRLPDSADPQAVKDTCEDATERLLDEAGGADKIIGRVGKVTVSLVYTGPDKRGFIHAPANTIIDLRLSNS